MWGRLAAAILVWMAGTTALHAGDGSAVNLLGFSADGRYFAFEQYGERGGNGEVFSEIYTIDVRDDRFEEAPIREAWVHDNGARHPANGKVTLGDIRRRAAATAAPSLKRLAITVPGAAAAANAEARSGDILGQIHIGPVREAAREALTLDRAALGMPSRLVLRDVAMDVKRCENLVQDGKPKGIVLVLEREGRPPLTLSQDRSIPASRGCPDRYGLAGAYVLPRPDGSTALAVLIQYFYSAFEGPDRRFFAVTAAVR